MYCPRCQQNQFEVNKSCSECGFQGDPNRLDELSHLQWLLEQMDEWKALDIDTTAIFKLKEVYASYLKATQVALGLRSPSFASDEAEKIEKAWVELEHLEILFEKVEDWRAAGYFKEEIAALDPIKKQRARAEELRQRLDGVKRPELNQAYQDKLKTASFLLDQVDLIASREWFKSKTEIEKVVVPIMASMMDVMLDHESDDN